MEAVARRPDEGPDAAPRDPSESFLLALFAASGCAALIYEIVWFHLLRLVIGASALSMGILLASFMGGMCLGSLFLGRLLPSRWSPLRAYAALEVGIGLFGLLLPLLIPALRTLYFELFGFGPRGVALRAAICGLALLPPTALMGATLPAVARRYARARAGTGLAQLYGANTAGAVLGCVLAGFYLLPRWDILVATAVAAVLNFLVAAVAWRLARLPAPRPALVVTTASGPGSDNIVYIVTALSGLTALGAQVVWTRLLGLLFGGTTYTFAIILAVILGGIGLGSAAAGIALRRGHDSRALLAGTQLALVPALWCAATLIAKVVPYAATGRNVPIDVLHVLHTLRCLEVILPAAVLWGMSFPLALAAAAPLHGDAGLSSGNVYAANTVGAIAGALLVSFVTIPAWGTRTSERLLVVAAGLSAALMYAALRRRAAVVALAVAVAVAFAVPGLPDTFLANGRYIWLVNSRDRFPYVSEGAASTVAVSETAEGIRYFHVSGKVEASTDNFDMRLQRVLGHLTALVHRNPRSVLVVGLGAGVTAGTFVVHPSVKRIVICEIEPQVIPAARDYFGRQNHAVLSDPRVQVINDDARHFLATTREQFDVITSDPIHPWVRGNSVLFSKEYYATVKQRLAPGGVASQWVPLYETSEAAIKVQVRTFLEAFPQGAVWNSQPGQKGYDVVLLGQAQPAPLQVADIQARIDASPELQRSLAEVGLGSAVELLASYGAGSQDMAAFLAGIEPNRDFSLKLEYLSGRALNLQVADGIYRSMTRFRKYPEDFFVAPPELDAALRKRFFGR
jgi:spermidine synthase